MSLIVLLQYLYSVVGIISLAGYLPQIFKLISAEDRVDSISIQTWTLWTCTNGIVVAYAFFASGDPYMQFVASMNLVGTWSLLGLTIYVRFIKFHDATSSQEERIFLNAENRKL